MYSFAYHFLRYGCCNTDGDSEIKSIIFLGSSIVYADSSGSISILVMNKEEKKLLGKVVLKFSKK